MKYKLVMLAIGILVVAFGIQVYKQVSDDRAGCYAYTDKAVRPPAIPPREPGIHYLVPPIQLHCPEVGNEAPIDLDALNLPADNCKIRFYFTGCMSFDPACPMCVRFFKDNTIVTQSCPSPGWNCRVAEWTGFIYYQKTPNRINRVVLWPCYNDWNCEYWGGGGDVEINKFELVCEPYSECK